MELSNPQDENVTAGAAHLPKEQNSAQVNTITSPYIESCNTTEEQDQKEEVKQTRSHWDELISYRYAIF